MTSEKIRDLYVSQNGDRWTLVRNMTGSLTVVHQPNSASGGRASEHLVEDFLSQRGDGPEHQILRQAVSDLAEWSPEERAAMSCALGLAVARCWSDLSQDAQHKLFEAAVRSEGEVIRQQLAIFLHSKHARTQDVVRAQEIREPESLG